MTQPAGKGRLIIASARLPVSIHRPAPDAALQVNASPGGLATALRAIAGERPFLWVGWPGAAVAEEDQPEVSGALAASGGVVPVYLDSNDVEGWYEELSNRVLWPLFHALPAPTRVAPGAWRRYREVNARFATTIAEVARPGDTVWIHDYQLALVPQLLRRAEIDCAVGFFLHIPFPASETFRTLPMREEILQGMLGASFIGFHAYEYVSHFRSSIQRILGIESEPEHVALPTHHARMGALPIGIDPVEIDAIGRSPEAIAELEELTRRYQGRKVILGVDRLDYTKGLPQRLLAFEEMLEKHPELRDKVVYIQIAAPSRQGVAEYRRLKREVDELIGRVSGKFSSVSGSPLVYINQNVPRERLVPLYQLADVALVTPLRDGMNLVCLEYVAARGDRPGTLILSEFTGAAQCLSGAVLVNPYNISQMASAMAEALAVDPAADQPGEGTPEAFAHMREFVHGNTAVVWAQRFLDRLEATWREFGGRARRLRVRAPDVAARLDAASRPLVLLDYDGTLQPHVRVPAQAAPGREVRELLRQAAEVARVYVVSGRPAAVLDGWLGTMPIGLVCEHGLSTKHPDGTWSEPPKVDAGVLDETVLPLLQDFCDRTPGSRIERKAASLAWHYRGSDPGLGSWRAGELSNQLGGRLTGQPYSVLMGSRVVEVRHAAITKGAAVSQILAANADCDFVLCAGNDRTDEDMFHQVVASQLASLVVHVGGLHTSAEFFVEAPADLVAELRAVLARWRDHAPQQHLRSASAP